MMKPPAAYSLLYNELGRLHRLVSILHLLGWDEQVNLPKGSAEHRAEELKTLSDVLHRERTQPIIGEWLEELESEGDSLSEEEKTVLREARREYDRAVKIPPSFVAEKSALESRAFHAWAEARKKSDFSLFAPFLEEQIEMAKKEAGFLGFSGESAYDYHIDQHDPGLTARIIDPLFKELRSALSPLLEKILESPKQPDLSPFKGFAVEKQEAFLREVTARIGFDYNRGRIDRSLHPFCSGDGSDTRMTTRFNPDIPLDSLFSSIHETGHGLYEQGLPLEHLGTGLGEAVGMAVHESQSRLWENQVGRSRGFWDFWEPRFKAVFPEQLASVPTHDLYFAINAVKLIPIRVDSDEVSYNLHIILRFELEELLFTGALKVDDLPSEWNQRSREIIGIKPADDAEGVLQDIHWSGGSFGYFPSYCLGNMLAAQIWYAAREQLPRLEDDFREGNFHPLLHWLRENIHRRGKQLDTMALTREVTGRELSPECLIRYLKDRYLPLYC